MRTRVKVCCIASVAEARLAIAQGADALGLVGEMPSGPGVISDETAAEIAAAVPPPVTAFLLSSRDDAESLAEHVRTTGVSALQIVRHLDPGEYSRLRRLLPTTKLVQVLHVEDEASLELAQSYGGLADLLLLDSGRPSAAELGGTGRVHDWDLSARIVAASPIPVFLAGGLRPDNVARAVARVRPFGVDLCSGIRRDGALDLDLLTAFTTALRDEDVRDA